MITENKTYIRIMNDYSQKRILADEKCRERMKEVFEAVPELAELAERAQQLGIENMGKILRDRENAAKYNAELAEKLDEIRARREEILAENGIEPDFDKPAFECKKCGDTGYVGGEKCACLKQQLIDCAYEMSNMKTLCREQSFDNFDLSYYGDAKIAGLNMTERENIEDIVNRCINFCKNPAGAKNLFFFGKPGLGKTFLSSAIARELLDKGYTVIYSGASRLFALYDDYRFGRMSDSEDFEDMLALVYDADLLIIDDLGVEMHGPSAYQFLFHMINDRILKNKRMIISTNLNMEEISKVYSPRITSRLYDAFDCLRFEGRDIRTQKLIRAKKN